MWSHPYLKTEKILLFSLLLCCKVRTKHAHAVHDLHSVNLLPLPLRREFKPRRDITKSYVTGSSEPKSRKCLVVSVTGCRNACRVRKGNQIFNHSSQGILWKWGIFTSKPDSCAPNENHQTPRKHFYGSGKNGVCVKDMSFTLTFTNTDLIKLRWQASGCPGPH